VSLLQLQLLDRVQAGPADGSPGTPALQQPRKLAVLAYLALADRPVPRTELATLLWGDTTDASARGSVRQVLHAIRTDCGFDPFIADRSTIQLNDKYIFCDVVQCYRALAFNPTADVVARYAGAFMPGFTIGGGSAFDDWCDAQRNRFDIALADAAWNAADQCSDARAALELLEIAAQRRPLDQSILRRRMRCLQDIGEVGEALALYEAFRVQLREQTGASPAKDTNELAHELLNAARDAVVIPADALMPPDAVALETTGSESTTAEPRGLRAQAARAREHLRAHTGRLVAAAVLVIALYVGFVMSDGTQAAEALPLVSVNEITVEGADSAHQHRIILDLTALLDEDPAFRVSRSSSREADASLSVAIDVASGLDGVARLNRRDEAEVRVVMLVNTTKSEAEAIEGVANRLRREIEILLAPDDQAERAARLQYRVDGVFELIDGGAYAAARQALATIDREIADARIRRSDRRLLRSRSFEAQSFVQLLESRNIAGALEFSQKAIVELTSGDSTNEATGQRLARLYFLAFAFDASNEEHLVRAIAYAEQVPESRRLPSTWIKLAQGHHMLNEHRNALAIGRAARAELPSLGTSEELDLIMFESALALGESHVARQECERIRSREGTQFHAISCAVSAMGWAGARYDARQLLREVARMDEASDQRALHQQTLTLWIAAASAQLKQSALADSLLAVTADTALESDQMFARALALSKLGRANDARPILTALEQDAYGRRVLRARRWMLDR
jgi:DNA-binding SARP family transcriptional activator